MPLGNFLETPTRVLFFTGKGGVGKTSIACAAAIALADSGKRVLLVSTDPASNLDEVLGVALQSTPTRIAAVPGLAALNIDPHAAAVAYRERLVAPYRSVLPKAAIASIEEQLSGACTTEIAAFDEFSRLLGDPSNTAEFDHVLFDTAPTGHTLRLLELPAAWSTFIDTNLGGTSCLGPLAGLTAQRALYIASNQALRDATQTTLVLVARLELSSLRETERTRGELAPLGVANLHLVVNGVFQARDPQDPTAVAMDARARAALAQLPAALAHLPRVTVPLFAFGLVGVSALRRVGHTLLQGTTHAWADNPRAADAEAFTQSEKSASPTAPVAATLALTGFVDHLASHGHGVVMTMGKGGVGKTTIAARVAGALAARGFAVTLTTTDPAAHVEAAVGELGLAAPSLRICRIDPHVETQRYTESVLATAGEGLDAQGRALLAEDLRSPCTEEIAVFRAFAETVAQGQDRFVVIDTAPTGHTLLLLDAAEAYHREVLKKASGSPEAVQRLLPRLRDTAFTHVLLVALPEATPIHEAMQLERDLARAAIYPFAWVVNQCLTPLQVSDPVLRMRQANERGHLDELAKHTARLVLEPWRA